VCFQFSSVLSWRWSHSLSNTSCRSS
jgi:hypothetical protein